MRSYEYDDDGRVTPVADSMVATVRRGKARSRQTYLRPSFGEWLRDVRGSFAIWFGLVGVAALVFWCASSRVM